MINADIKIYAPAIVQTAISASFESLRTLEIIVIDFEYLAALTTLNTFKARSILSVFNIRNSFKSLNELLSDVSDGIIDNKSTIAIKVKGYLIKEDMQFNLKSPKKSKSLSDSLPTYNFASPCPDPILFLRNESARVIYSSASTTL